MGKKSISMFIFMAVLIFSSLAFAENDQTSSANLFIPKGTPIAVELADSVSTRSTFVGETLTVNVLEDIVINNVVVIEKGSKGFISVVDFKRSGSWGKAGGVVIQPQYLKTVNYVKVPLAGTVKTSGEGHGVITPVVLGGAGGAWSESSSELGAFASLLILPNPTPGKDAAIPAGTKLIVTVNEDTNLGTDAENLEEVMTKEVIRKGSSEVSKAQNWTGTWTSSRGKITLFQPKGSYAVTGTYERGHGKITGVVKGDKLVGRWVENISDRAPSGAGEFEFVIGSNGTSVLMLWKGDYSNNWVEDKLGRRVTGL